MDEAAAKQALLPASGAPVPEVRRGRRTIFYGWWIVAIASVMHCFHGGLYGTGMVVYFLPVARDLGVTRAALSLAFTLRSLESGLDGPLIGYLVDRVGPRSMIRAGATLGGLGFVLLGLTQDYLSFLLVFLGVLALGMSSGVGHSSMALLNNWFARRRATAITLGHIGTEVGGALFTPLVGLMVLNAGWRPTAMLSGALLPLVLLPLTFFIRNTPESMGLGPDGDRPFSRPGGEAPSGAGAEPPGRETGEFGVREAMRTRTFWHLALAMGFRQFAKTGLHVHLVPLMVWKGVDEPAAAVLVGLLAFCQVPSRIAGAWLGDRWSMTRTPALSCLVGVVALGVLAFGPAGPLWTSVAFVLLFALAESGNLVSWAIVGHFFGRNRFATLRGAISTVSNPLTLAAPVFLGWVFDRTDSYYWALLPMIASYAVASVLYAALQPPVQRDHPTGA